LLNSQPSGFRFRAAGACAWRRALVLGVLIGGGAAAGCRQDMHDGPRFTALQQNPFYADQRSSRPLVDGTVARGQLRDNDVFYTGMSAPNTPVALIPMAVTKETIERGHDRFNVYCTPCHGKTGEGNGMIVQRGYKQPPTLHDARLRASAAGYFYDVMTHGFGQMPDYAAQITPQDRWAVVAYIRALQLSQHATLADVPEADRGKLDAGPSSHTPGAAEGAPKHD
jgi:mono/diheme cytochrome c family protein